MKKYIILLFLFTNIFYSKSQSTQVEPVFTSLREFCGVDHMGSDNNLENALSVYYGLEFSMIHNDPELKQKLIDEFISEIKKLGYELPKKVKKDYFDPYSFILYLVIYFDKNGNILPIQSVIVKANTKPSL